MPAEPEPLDLEDLPAAEQDEILLIIDAERQAFKLKLDHLKSSDPEFQPKKGDFVCCWRRLQMMSLLNVVFVVLCVL